MNKQQPLDVYIVSDATGRTAEAVVQAVLVQFPGIRPRLRRFPRVQTRERMIEILDEAQKRHGIVTYSLVSAELRTFVRQEGRKRDLPLFDLLGPLINKVRRVFRIMPVAKPGLLAHVREEATRTSEAIEFTLRHDDGLEPETLAEADVVILGVSRTSKTPTSVFLACNQALKVANLPIILDHPLPEGFAALPVPKLGFMIDPERLATIRRERYQGIEGYADPGKVLREVEYARTLYDRIPNLRMVDVTNRSIEEIADRVMDYLNSP